MTPPIQGRTAVDRDPRPLEPAERVQGVGPLLEALSDEGCLQVLRLLAAGHSDASEIATELGVTEADVRAQIARLKEACPAAAGGGRDDWGVIYHAVRLMHTVLNNGKRAEDNEFTRLTLIVPEQPSIPQPPYACTVCDNSGFVFGLLDELRTASAQLRNYHARLQEMSSQVLTAHEAERLRIARELHDDTAQAITSMLVRLRLLERSPNADEVLQNLEELRELTAGALDSVRRLAMDLRPAALDDLGLVPALHSFVERHAEDWEIEIPVTVRGVKRRLPRDVELVLYRVLQEALTNVAKHADATRAEVTLKRWRNQVTLVISDDGKGLDKQRSKSRDTGLGLFGMRERLALVNGELEIESQPGKGTTITARVPLPSYGRESRRTT